jgi:GT2 family glycosyltransferase
VVIAAHNEGDLLWKTVGSSIAAAPTGFEIIVADDASSDGSVLEMRRRFPQVPVVANPLRLGVSPTKDLGARRSRGATIVFLDGHSKPEPGSLQRLVADVERFQGRVVMMPMVATLDPVRWQNSRRLMGCCYGLKTASLDGHWRDGKSARRWGPFVESPALVGCCVAVSRNLYRDLKGFDPHMREWGAEDLDFGLKAWLTGHPILTDTGAIVGHKFRKAFDSYTVTAKWVAANKLRMARKHLQGRLWSAWIEQFRRTLSNRVWHEAWSIFAGARESAEAERKHLLARRTRDELWWAEEFGYAWPTRSRGWSR